MKKLMIGLLACVFIASPSFAEQAKRETIEKIFTLTDMQKILDGAYQQLEGLFKQSTANMQLNDADKAVVDKFNAQSIELIRADLSWEKLKEPMIDVYVSTFTEEDAKAILKFYQSPAGKKTLEKMPELMQKSIGITQGMMRDFVPKLQKLQGDMMKELQENHKADAPKPATNSAK